MKEKYQSIIIILITVVLIFSSFAFLFSRTQGNQKNKEGGCPPENLIWVNNQKVCLRSNPDQALQVPVVPNETAIKETLTGEQVEKVYFLIDANLSKKQRSKVTVSAIEISKGLGMKGKNVTVAFNGYLPDLPEGTPVLSLENATPSTPIVYPNFGNLTYVNVVVDQSIVAVVGQNHQALDLACNKVFLSLW